MGSAGAPAALAASAVRAGRQVTLWALEDEVVEAAVEEAVLEAEEVEQFKRLEKAIVRETAAFYGSITARRTRNEGRARLLNAMRAQRAATLKDQSRPMEAVLESSGVSGKLVAEAPARGTTQGQLAQWMVGHAVDLPQRRPTRHVGPTVCELRGVSTAPAPTKLPAAIDTPSRMVQLMPSTQPASTVTCPASAARAATKQWSSIVQWCDTWAPLRTMQLAPMRAKMRSMIPIRTRLAGT